MNKKILKNFIVGTVLGDSSLYGKKNKGVYMAHSEKQKDYLEWKANFLKESLNVGLNYNKKGRKINTGYSVDKRENLYEIYSTMHHKLTSLYKIIYINDKKTINDKVLKYFNDFSLAVLFMDNGCKETVLCKKTGNRKIKSYKFSLGSYSYEEVLLLSTHIKNFFNINNKVYLEHKKYPYIRISKKEDKEIFLNTVSKYIIDSMKYKIQV